MFKNLLTWLQSFWEHDALPEISTFATTVVADELPVAKQLVAAEIASIPADLAASKPLVAAAQAGQQALDNAKAQGISVGIGAITVAASNAVAELNSKPAA